MTTAPSFLIVTAIGAAVAAVSAIAVLMLRSRRRLCPAIEPPYHALRA